MSKELQIPLLHDLIAKGGVDNASSSESVNDNEHADLQIEQQVPFEEPAHHETPSHSATSHAEQTETENDDHIEDYTSLQELLIEEEIRMVLDKHMDAAYEEIVRLINHKLS